MFGIEHLTQEMERRFNDLRQNLGNWLDHIDSHLASIEGKVNTLATRQELDTIKGQLMAAINDAATRVTTDIQALRDALASGSPVTDQDLADLQSDIFAVGQIDMPTPPPTP